MFLIGNTAKSFTIFQHPSPCFAYVFKFPFKLDLVFILNVLFQLDIINNILYL